MIFLNFIGFSPSSGNPILSSVGININSTNGELISGDVASSGWKDMIFNPSTGLILIGITGAIIVGFFTKQFDWKLVLVGFFTAFVVQFISVGWSLIEMVPDSDGWLKAIIATIFLPLSAMFIFSIVEWFGGTE
jgi:hypothetical protein